MNIQQRKRKTASLTTEAEKSGFEKFSLRVHPRVFESLGNDLVTDDVVAVVELVKNSYDAFARNVRLRFDADEESRKRYLEIEDDGCGMTKETLERVWFVVATPFKAENPLAKSGRKQRRVSGEKGLGRFSAIRLGKRLRMLTQAEGHPCWEVEVDWSELLMADSLSKNIASCRRYPKKSPFSKTGSGTRLTIHDLNARWEQNQISELVNNLARLVSPFAQIDEFNISLANLEGFFLQEIKIDAPEFLENPKYSMRGKADEDGNIRTEYEFTPVSPTGVPRKKTIDEKWRNIYRLKENRDKLTFPSAQRARCGPFNFEIRAWDISSAGTEEIANRFNFKKNQVRKAIRAHKGISIYRDGVLVLPKSDKSRDWMGLDLRRVSKVGTRLSTNQIVGYVSISAERNPGIKDTSDRERLVSCAEVAEFEAILRTVVAIMENEREKDRREKNREEQKTESLFDQLSARKLLDKIVRISERGSPADKVVPSVERHAKNLETAREILRERFGYYSRLATIGSISSMLVHEIRNRTTVVGAFLNSFEALVDPSDKTLRKKHERAVRSVDSLEHLSDIFLPLASRNFRRRTRRGTILEKHIRECVKIRKDIMKRLDIECRTPKSRTPVAVDPGELDAIILNLLQNSEYWLLNSDGQREIEFELRNINGGERVQVSVHDTGPGINDDDTEKIFWPGVTAKPGGFGMGLTVASELVAAYDGNMSTIHPGAMGGASFVFDLPVKIKTKEKR